VQVNDDVMVKIIDIDLERRRISLSLKQANEGVDHTSDEFDPTLYGMAASYDEAGNYLYPEGFDSETGEWLKGYERQKEVWEKQYAEAHTRWEAHKQQIEEAQKADVEAGEASAYSSDDKPAEPSTGGTSVPTPADTATGSLASDEALQALREKLTGGDQ
jgi:small subunit ribosomal protein S1